MYRAEKVFLKYLKPETMRIELGLASGYNIVDDTGHHYGWTATLQEASKMLIALYSEHVDASHNYYLATSKELNNRRPEPITESQAHLNDLVNSLGL